MAAHVIYGWKIADAPAFCTIWASCAQKICWAILFFFQPVAFWQTLSVLYIITNEPVGQKRLGELMSDEINLIAYGRRGQMRRALCNVAEGADRGWRER